MVIHFFEYLEESWNSGYNPTLEKIKYDVQINDIISNGWFKEALLHLIKRDFIRIESDFNGIKRILRGKNPLPKNYDYSRFWFKI